MAGYIGNYPTAVPLTGADLTDGIITSAKIADGTITSADLASGNLTIPNGNLLFDTASKGIYLGVTSATASNLLDDYEEGTWTATVGAVSGFASTNLDNDYSTYTKIGNVVYIRTALQFPDSSGNVSVGDYIYMEGLPFAPIIADTGIMCPYRFNNSSNATGFTTTGATSNRIIWVCHSVIGTPARNGGRVSINFSYITAA